MALLRLRLGFWYCVELAKSWLAPVLIYLCLQWQRIPCITLPGKYYAYNACGHCITNSFSALYTFRHIIGLTGRIRKNSVNANRLLAILGTDEIKLIDRTKIPHVRIFAKDSYQIIEYDVHGDPVDTYDDGQIMI